jgi:hypothetical protein
MQILAVSGNVLTELAAQSIDGTREPLSTLDYLD